MKKLFIALCAALIFTACSQEATTETAAEPTADSISSASTSNYYEAISLQEGSDEFNEVMANPSAYGAVVVSTTNEDGTPNAAVVVPSLIDPENGQMIIAFGGDTNTKQNLLDRNFGIVTVMKNDVDAEDQNDKYGGARVVVELAEDQDTTLDQLVTDGDIEEANKDATVVLKIVKVLPLG